MADSAMPRPGAPRWLWAAALLLLAGAAVPGVWSADLLLRPPPVEEVPEGLIFLLAAGVVAIVSFPLGLVAAAIGLRRRPIAAVLVGVSTALSAPIVLLLTLPMLVPSPFERWVGGDDTASGTPAETSNLEAPPEEPLPRESVDPTAEVTGFGASEDAWLSAHQQAPGYMEGAAFLPIVMREGSEVPMYGGVSWETLVVSYTLNLPDDTSLRQAKQAVLAEFPPGAKFDIVDDDETTCLIATVQSPLAQRAMKIGGWGDWVPAAMFGTSVASPTELDPENVTDVTMLAVEPSEGEDVGSC